MKQLMDEIRLYKMYNLQSASLGYSVSMIGDYFCHYFPDPDALPIPQDVVFTSDSTSWIETHKYICNADGSQTLLISGAPKDNKFKIGSPPFSSTYLYLLMYHETNKEWYPVGSLVRDYTQYLFTFQCGYELLRIYPIDGLKVNFTDRPYVRTLSGKLKAKDKVYNGIDSVDITFYNHSVGSPEYGGRGLGAFNELWRMWGTEEQVLVLINPKAAYVYDGVNYSHFEPEVIEDRSPYTDAFNIDYDTYFPYYIGVVNNLPQDLIVAGWQSNGPFTISIGVDTFGTSVDNDIFDRYISYNPAASPFVPGANMVRIDKWE